MEVNLAPPVRTALNRCERLLRGFFKVHPRDHKASRRKWYAVGDPQTSALKFFEILHHHGLLAHTGWLRSDCGLIVCGDYFDFKPRPEDPSFDTLKKKREWMGNQGLMILKWLTTHPLDHIVVLIGNHDVARVCELDAFDDERFDKAYDLGVELLSDVREGRLHQEEAQRVFYEAYPRLVSPRIALEYFPAFQARQKEFLRRLLQLRRVQITAHGSIRGRKPVLITHAGITTQTLTHLQLKHSTAPEHICLEMNRFFFNKAALSLQGWRLGRSSPLDLKPLVLPTTREQVGGGVLSHRPIDPNTCRDPKLLRGLTPARYDPRDLPHGLTQIIGHVGHEKCVEAMPRWLDNKNTHKKLGNIRTLQIHKDKVHYNYCFVANQQIDTSIFMIDGLMQKCMSQDYEILPLETLNLPDL
jgi:hypothetical protein